MKLNEEQTLAVEHPLDAPACLIAGAGSGKTRVLTERVRWLMQHGIEPRRICGITFTNKAAGELIHRLGLDPRNLMESPRVSTIHSLALGGIRKNPKAFGLRDKVTPLDEWDQKQMVKKLVESKERYEEVWQTVSKLLDKISFHRARGIGFSVEYTDEIHAATSKLHGGYHALDEDDLELWKEFEDEKNKNSVVDFDDMLHLVVRRMRTDPRWLASLQRTFDHILMDEAQDTNPVQWEFVNGLLAPDNQNLYVVGDMSQSIYGFNGAVPQILKDFSEQWRGLHPTLYRIARNHRSVPEIVEFANLIQTKMTATIPLNMESWRGSQGEHGQVIRLDKDLPRSVAITISMEILKDSQRKKDPIPFKNNAILVRSGKTQVRDIETELIRRRIPYVIRGGHGLLQTEEIRDIMAYLRLVANHKDFMALCRASGAPRIGVGQAGLEKIRSRASEAFDGDLIAAAKEVKKGGLPIFVDMIEHASLFRDNPVSAVEKIIRMANYREYIRDKYKKEQGKVNSKIENVERFGLMVMMLAQDTENLTLEDLIFQLSLDRQRADAVEDEKEAIENAFATGKITEIERDSKLKMVEQGSVTISTIHSAKGLEWQRVYVTNVYESSLPHRWSLGSEEEIEEERRLFYVAATRARDTLVICVPQLVQSEANTSRVKPSRFLAEIGA